MSAPVQNSLMVETSARPHCMALAPDDPTQYAAVCTRRHGHDGDHVAHGIASNEYRRWPQEPTR